MASAEEGSGRVLRGMFGFLFLAGAVAGVFYALSYSILADNAYVNQEPVGHMTRAEVSAVLEKQIAALNRKEIVFQDDADVQRFSLNELDVTFDAAATVAQLFRDSHASWLDLARAQFSDSAATPRPRLVAMPAVNLNEAALKTAVETRLKKGERPVRDAAIAWQAGTGWVIVPAASGRRLEDGEADRVTKGIVAGLYSPEKSTTYRARYRTVEPARRESELAGMLLEVVARSRQPLTLQFAGVEEKIDLPGDPAGWFTFDYTAHQVLPNKAQAEQFITDFATRHDKPSRTVTVKRIDPVQSEYNRNTYFKAVTEGDLSQGLVADKPAATALLVDALGKADHAVIAVPAVQQPLQFVSEVPGVQFPALISRGASSFKLGHYANRVHNIKTGISIQSMTVIPQGAVFSFDEVLGWVTNAKGFKDAQVIFGNNVQEAPGGGLCQVSTTMFRAAVFAGLPIVQRSPHSWDVTYYRDVYGVDAAIFPPNRLDLQFKNDTPGPILIHGYTDDAAQMAYFDFYGTSDGRSVVISPVENIRYGKGRRVVNDWLIERADGASEKRQIVSVYRR